MIRSILLVAALVPLSAAFAQTSDQRAAMSQVTPVLSTSSMGAGAAALTREQVRAETLRALRDNNNVSQGEQSYIAP